MDKGDFKEQALSFYKRQWNLYDDSCLEYDRKSLTDLLSESKPIESKEIKFETKITDVDLDFKITTPYGISTCWLSEAVNNPDGIWYFLEDLVEDNYEWCFYCEEEGPDTFFYANKIDGDTIRFVHITNMKNADKYTDNTDFFKVKQDIIINKRLFISEIYNSLKFAYDNYKYDFQDYDVWDIRNREIMENLIKDSEIIKEYLKIQNQ